MIDQENGFTLLPYLATMDIKSSKRLKEFTSPVPSREVSLIYSQYFRKDKIKSNLIDNIQSHLPEGLIRLASKKIQIVDLPSGHHKA